MFGLFSEEPFLRKSSVKKLKMSCELREFIFNYVILMRTATSERLSETGSENSENYSSI